VNNIISKRLKIYPLRLIIPVFIVLKHGNLRLHLLLEQLVKRLSYTSARIADGNYGIATWYYGIKLLDDPCIEA